jgi:hypothetical protein
MSDTRSETDPQGKTPDQIMRALGLGRNRDQELGRGAALGGTVFSLAALAIADYDASGIRDISAGSNGLFAIGIGNGLWLTIAAAFAAALVVASRDWAAAPLVSVVLILMTVSGFFHVTYGENVHKAKFCKKTHWSLRETFVDVGELLRVGRRTPDNAAVVDALATCNVVQIEHHAADD